MRREPSGENLLDEIRLESSRFKTRLAQADGSLHLRGFLKDRQTGDRYASNASALILDSGVNHARTA